MKQINSIYSKVRSRLIEKEETGIIVYVQSYQSNNKIIKILTVNNGVLIIIARGVRKITSKNKYKISLFDEINFTYFTSAQKQKMYLLKKINIVNRNSVNVLINFKCAAVIADVVAVILANDQNYVNANALVFIILHECLNNINKWKTINLIIFYNYYMLKLLSILGIRFTITKCASCQQNKNIICLSLEGGGIICKKCAQYEKLPRDKIIYMQIFRIFYQEKKIEYLDKIIYDEIFLKWLHMKLAFFIKNYYAINLSFSTVISDE